MLHSQTNIDMMYHHNMLSITVFTLLTSFARKSRDLCQKLALCVCLPTLAAVLHPKTKLPQHPLYSKADYRAINLLLECSQFFVVCVCVYIYTEKESKCDYTDYWMLTFSSQVRSQKCSKATCEVLFFILEKYFNIILGKW